MAILPLCPQPRSEAPNALIYRRINACLQGHFAEDIHDCVSKRTRAIGEYSGTSASEVIESRHHRPYYPLRHCEHKRSNLHALANPRASQHAPSGSLVTLPVVAHRRHVAL